MTLIDELREICKGMSAANHTEFQYECMQIIEFYDRVDVLRVAYEEYKGAYKAALRKQINSDLLNVCFKSYIDTKADYYNEKKQLDRVLKRIRKELNERKELGPIINEWEARRTTYLNLHRQYCQGNFDEQTEITPAFNESKYAYLYADALLRDAKRDLKQKKKGLK